MTLLAHINPPQIGRSSRKSTENPLVQHGPVFRGQISYRKDRRKGRKMGMRGNRAKARAKNAARRAKARTAVRQLGREMRIKAEAICNFAGIRHDVCWRNVEWDIESVDRGKGSHRKGKGAGAN